MDTPRGKAGCFSFRLRRGASGRFLTFLLFGLHRYFLFTPDFSHQGVRCGVLLSAFLFRHSAGPVCSSRTRWSFLVSLLAPNLCPSSICFDLLIPFDAFYSFFLYIFFFPFSFFFESAFALMLPLDFDSCS